MIEDLAGRVDVTRAASHEAHWRLARSGFHHIALGEFYEALPGMIDEIVEVFQGRSGLIDAVKYPPRPNPANLVAHLRSEADWIEVNRAAIAEKSESIGALVDDLAALYWRTIYKLENLR